MNNIFIIAIIILFTLLNIFIKKNSKKHISENFISSEELKKNIFTDKGDSDRIDHLDKLYNGSYCFEPTDGIDYKVLSKKEQDYYDTYCDTHFKKSDISKLFVTLIDKEDDFKTKVISGNKIAYFNLTDNHFIKYQNYTIIADKYDKSEYSINTTLNYIRNKKEFVGAVSNKNGECLIIKDKNYKLETNNSFDSYVKIQSQQFSYSFWIKITKLVDEPRLLFYKGKPDELFPEDNTIIDQYNQIPSVWIDKDTTSILIFIRMLDRLEKVTINSGYIPVNEQVHMSITFHNKNLKIYIDNILIINKEFSSSIYADKNNDIYINPYDIGGVEISNLLFYKFSIPSKYKFNPDIKIDNTHLLNKNIRFLLNYRKPANFETFWYNEQYQKFENKKLYLIDSDQSHRLFSNMIIDNSYKLDEPSYVNYNNLIFLSGSLPSLYNGNLLELPKKILPQKNHYYISGISNGENIVGKISIDNKGVVVTDNTDDKVEFTLDNISYSLNKSNRFMQENVSKSKFITIISENYINIASMIISDNNDYTLVKDDYDVNILSDKLIEIVLKKETIIEKVIIINNSELDNYNTNLLGAEIRLIDKNKELINYKVWNDDEFINTSEIDNTISGTKCQNWNEQSPHNHTYTNTNWRTKAFKLGNHNYCRNPEPKQKDGLWCYTKDPSKEWEYCKVNDKHIELGKKIYPNKKTFYFKSLFHSDNTHYASYDIVDNIVFLSGLIRCYEEIPKNDPIIAVLPKNIRPVDRKTFNVFGTNDTKNVRLDILPNGSIKLITNNNKNGVFDKETQISLDGIRYRKNNDYGSRLFLTDIFQAYNYINDQYGLPMKHIEDNLVSLSGVAIIVSKDVNLKENNILAKLPYKYRPNSNLFFQCNQNKHSVNLEINPDGEISVKNFNKQEAFISLDGIFYYISKGPGRIKAELDPNLSEGGTKSSIKLRAREKYNKASQKIIQDKVNLSIISGDISVLENAIEMAKEYNNQQSIDNVSDRFKVNLQSAQDLLLGLKSKKTVYDKLIDSMKNIDHNLIYDSLQEAIKYNKNISNDNYKINLELINTATKMVEFLKIKKQNENKLREISKSTDLEHVKNTLLEMKIYNNSRHIDFKVNLDETRHTVVKLFTILKNNTLSLAIDTISELDDVIKKLKSISNNIKNYNNTLDKDEEFYKINRKDIDQHLQGSIKKKDLISDLTQILKTPSSNLLNNENPYNKSPSTQTISVYNEHEYEIIDKIYETIDYNVKVEKIYKVNYTFVIKGLFLMLKDKIKLIMSLPINTTTTMSDTYDSILDLIKLVKIFNDIVNNSNSLDILKYRLDLEEINNHKKAILVKTQYTNDLIVELNNPSVKPLTEQIMKIHSYNIIVEDMYKIILHNPKITLRELVINDMKSTYNLPYNEIEVLENSTDLMLKIINKIKYHNNLPITEDRYKIINELSSLENTYQTFKSKLQAEKRINLAIINPNLQELISASEQVGIHNNNYGNKYSIKSQKALYLIEMFELRNKIESSLNKILSVEKIVKISDNVLQDPLSLKFPTPQQNITPANTNLSNNNNQTLDNNTYSLNVLKLFINNLIEELNKAELFNKKYETQFHINNTQFYNLRDLLVNKRNLEQEILLTLGKPIDTLSNIKSLIKFFTIKILEIKSENNNRGELYTIYDNTANDFLEKLIIKRDLIEKLKTTIITTVNTYPLMENITSLSSVIEEIENVNLLSSESFKINIINSKILKNTYIQLLNIYINPDIRNLESILINIDSYNSKVDNPLFKINQNQKITDLLKTLNNYNNLYARINKIIIKPDINHIDSISVLINEINQFNIKTQNIWENDINNYVTRFKLETYKLEKMLEILKMKRSIDQESNFIFKNPTVEKKEKLSGLIPNIINYNNLVNIYLDYHPNINYYKITYLENAKNLLNVLTSNIVNKKALDKITAIGKDSIYPTKNSIQNLKNTINDVDQHNLKELPMPVNISINDFDIDTSRGNKFVNTIQDRNYTSQILKNTFDNAVKYEINIPNSQQLGGTPANMIETFVSNQCTGDMCIYTDNYEKHISNINVIINDLSTVLSLGNSFNKDKINKIWGNDINPEIISKYSVNIDQIDLLLKTVTNHKLILDSIQNLFKYWNVDKPAQKEIKDNVSIENALNRVNGKLKDIDSNVLRDIINKINLHNESLETNWKNHTDYENILLKFKIDKEFLNRLSSTLNLFNQSVTEINKFIKNPTVAHLKDLERIIILTEDNNNKVNRLWSEYYYGKYNITIVKTYTLNLEKLYVLLSILKSQYKSEEVLNKITGKIDLAYDSKDDKLPDFNDKNKLINAINDAKKHNTFVNNTQNMLVSIDKNKFIISTVFGEDLVKLIDEKHDAENQIQNFLSTNFNEVDILKNDILKIKSVYDTYASLVNMISNKYIQKKNDILTKYSVNIDLLNKSINGQLTIIENFTKLKTNYTNYGSLYKKYIEYIINNLQIKVVHQNNISNSPSPSESDNPGKSVKSSSIDNAKFKLKTYMSPIMSLKQESSTQNTSQLSDTNQHVDKKSDKYNVNILNAEHNSMSKIKETINLYNSEYITQYKNIINSYETKFIFDSDTLIINTEILDKLIMTSIAFKNVIVNIQDILKIPSAINITNLDNAINQLDDYNKNLNNNWSINKTSYKDRIISKYNIEIKKYTVLLNILRKKSKVVFTYNQITGNTQNSSLPDKSKITELENSIKNCSEFNLDLDNSEDIPDFINKNIYYINLELGKDLVKVIYEKDNFKNHYDKFLSINFENLDNLFDKIKILQNKYNNYNKLLELISNKHSNKKTDIINTYYIDIDMLYKQESEKIINGLSQILTIHDKHVNDYNLEIKNVCKNSNIINSQQEYTKLNIIKETIENFNDNLASMYKNITKKYTRVFSFNLNNLNINIEFLKNLMRTISVFNSAQLQRAKILLNPNINYISDVENCIQLLKDNNSALLEQWNTSSTIYKNDILNKYKIPTNKLTNLLKILRSKKNADDNLKVYTGYNSELPDIDDRIQLENAITRANTHNSYIYNSPAIPDNINKTDYKLSLELANDLKNLIIQKNMTKESIDKFLRTKFSDIDILIFDIEKHHQIFQAYSNLLKTIIKKYPNKKNNILETYQLSYDILESKNDKDQSNNLNIITNLINLKNNYLDKVSILGNSIKATCVDLDISNSEDDYNNLLTLKNNISNYNLNLPKIYQSITDTFEKKFSFDINTLIINYNDLITIIKTLDVFNKTINIKKLILESPDTNDISDLEKCIQIIVSNNTDLNDNWINSKNQFKNNILKKYNINTDKIESLLSILKLKKKSEKELDNYTGSSPSQSLPTISDIVNLENAIRGGENYNTNLINSPDIPINLTKNDYKLSLTFANDLNNLVSEKNKTQNSIDKMFKQQYFDIDILISKFVDIKSIYDKYINLLNYNKKKYPDKAEDIESSYFISSDILQNIDKNQTEKLTVVVQLSNLRSEFINLKSKLVRESEDISNNQNISDIVYEYNKLVSLSDEIKLFNSNLPDKYNKIKNMFSQKYDFDVNTLQISLDFINKLINTFKIFNNVMKYRQQVLNNPTTDDIDRIKQCIRLISENNQSLTDNWSSDNSNHSNQIMKKFRLNSDNINSLLTILLSKKNAEFKLKKNTGYNLSPYPSYSNKKDLENAIDKSENHNQYLNISPAIPNNIDITNYKLDTLLAKDLNDIIIKKNYTEIQIENFFNTQFQNILLLVSHIKKIKIIYDDYIDTINNISDKYTDKKNDILSVYFIYNDLLQATDEKNPEELSILSKLNLLIESYNKNLQFLNDNMTNVVYNKNIGDIHNEYDDLITVRNQINKYNNELSDIYSDIINKFDNKFMFDVKTIRLNTGNLNKLIETIGRYKNILIKKEEVLKDTNIDNITEIISIIKDNNTRLINEWEYNKSSLKKSILKKFKFDSSEFVTLLSILKSKKEANQKLVKYTYNESKELPTFENKDNLVDAIGQAKSHNLFLKNTTPIPSDLNKVNYQLSLLLGNDLNIILDNKNKTEISIDRFLKTEFTNITNLINEFNNIQNTYNKYITLLDTVSNKYSQKKNEIRSFYFIENDLLQDTDSQDPGKLSIVVKLTSLSDNYSNKQNSLNKIMKQVNSTTQISNSIADHDNLNTVYQDIKIYNKSLFKIFNEINNQYSKKYIFDVSTLYIDTRDLSKIINTVNNFNQTYAYKNKLIKNPDTSSIPQIKEGIELINNNNTILSNDWLDSSIEYKNNILRKYYIIPDKIISLLQILNSQKLAEESMNLYLGTSPESNFPTIQEKVKFEEVLRKGDNHNVKVNTSDPIPINLTKNEYKIDMNLANDIKVILSNKNIIQTSIGKLYSKDFIDINNLILTIQEIEPIYNEYQKLIKFNIEKYPEKNSKINSMYSVKNNYFEIFDSVQKNKLSIIVNLSNLKSSYNNNKKQLEDTIHNICLNLDTNNIGREFNTLYDIYEKISLFNKNLLDTYQNINKNYTKKFSFDVSTLNINLDFSKKLLDTISMYNTALSSKEEIFQNPKVDDITKIENCIVKINNNNKLLSNYWSSEKSDHVNTSITARTGKSVKSSSIDIANLKSKYNENILKKYYISINEISNLLKILKSKKIAENDIKQYIDVNDKKLPEFNQGNYLATSINNANVHNNLVNVLPEIPINTGNIPDKFFFIGSDSNQHWCELAGIKIYDLDNIEITNKMTNLSWIVTPNDGETNVNNVPRHGNAPMWREKSFSLWTPNSKHRNKKLFSFNLQDTSIGRVEVYTTNTESFGSSPKIADEDGSIIFHTGANGGLSVHYRAMSNKVFSNGILSLPNNSVLTMGENAINPKTSKNSYILSTVLATDIKNLLTERKQTMIKINQFFQTDFNDIMLLINEFNTIKIDYDKYTNLLKNVSSKHSDKNLFILKNYAINNDLLEKMDNNQLLIVKNLRVLKDNYDKNLELLTQIIHNICNNPSVSNSEEEYDQLMNIISKLSDSDTGYNTILLKTYRDINNQFNQSYSFDVNSLSINLEFSQRLLNTIKTYNAAVQNKYKVLKNPTIDYINDIIECVEVLKNNNNLLMNNWNDYNGKYKNNIIKKYNLDTVKLSTLINILKSKKEAQLSVREYTGFNNKTLPTLSEKVDLENSIRAGMIHNNYVSNSPGIPVDIKKDDYELNLELANDLKNLIVKKNIVSKGINEFSEKGFKNISNVIEAIKTQHRHYSTYINELENIAKKYPEKKERIFQKYYIKNDLLNDISKSETKSESGIQIESFTNFGEGNLVIVSELSKFRTDYLYYSELIDKQIKDICTNSSTKDSENDYKNIVSAYDKINKYNTELEGKYNRLANIYTAKYTFDINTLKINIDFAEKLVLTIKKFNEVSKFKSEILQDASISKLDQIEKCVNNINELNKDVNTIWSSYSGNYNVYKDIVIKKYTINIEKIDSLLKILKSKKKAQEKLENTIGDKNQFPEVGDINNLNTAITEAEQHNNYTNVSPTIPDNLNKDKYYLSTLLAKDLKNLLTLKNTTQNIIKTFLTQESISDINKLISGIINLEIDYKNYNRYLTRISEKYPDKKNNILSAYTIDSQFLRSNEVPNKFFFVGSDSNQQWCELAGIKIYDLDNIEITNKMTNLSWIVTPNDGETNVNNVPRHGNAPMWREKSFSLWTPNSKHRNKKLFSFNLQDTSIGRVEVYTTNTESFGSSPKIADEDGSIIFHTGDNGGLSVHYRAISNKVFSNGVLSQPEPEPLSYTLTVTNSLPSNGNRQNWAILYISLRDTTGVYYEFTNAEGSSHLRPGVDEPENALTNTNNTTYWHSWLDNETQTTNSGWWKTVFIPPSQYTGELEVYIRLYRFFAGGTVVITDSNENVVFTYTSDADSPANDWSDLILNVNSAFNTSSNNSQSEPEPEPGNTNLTMGEKAINPKLPILNILENLKYNYDNNLTKMNLLIENVSKNEDISLLNDQYLQLNDIKNTIKSFNDGVVSKYSDISKEYKINLPFKYEILKINLEMLELLITTVSTFNKIKLDTDNIIKKPDISNIENIEKLINSYDTNNTSLSEIWSSYNGIYKNFNTDILNKFKIDDNEMKSLLNILKNKRDTENSLNRITAYGSPALNLPRLVDKVDLENNLRNSDSYNNSLNDYKELPNNLNSNNFKINTDRANQLSKIISERKIINDKIVLFLNTTFNDINIFVSELSILKSEYDKFNQFLNENSNKSYFNDRVKIINTYFIDKDILISDNYSDLVNRLNGIKSEYMSLNSKLDEALSNVTNNMITTNSTEQQKQLVLLETEIKSYNMNLEENYQNIKKIFKTDFKFNYNTLLINSFLLDRLIASIKSFNIINDSRKITLDKLTKLDMTNSYSLNIEQLDNLIYNIKLHNTTLNENWNSEKVSSSLTNHPIFNSSYKDVILKKFTVATSNIEKLLLILKSRKNTKTNLDDITGKSDGSELPSYDQKSVIDNNIKQAIEHNNLVDKTPIDIEGINNDNYKLDKNFAQDLKVIIDKRREFINLKESFINTEFIDIKNFISNIKIFKEKYDTFINLLSEMATLYPKYQDKIIEKYIVNIDILIGSNNDLNTKYGDVIHKLSQLNNSYNTYSTELPEKLSLFNSKDLINENDYESLVQIKQNISSFNTHVGNIYNEILEKSNINLNFKYETLLINLTDLNRIINETRVKLDKQIDINNQQQELIDSLISGDSKYVFGDADSIQLDINSINKVLLYMNSLVVKAAEIKKLNPRIDVGENLIKMRDTMQQKLQIYNYIRQFTEITNPFTTNIMMDDDSINNYDSYILLIDQILNKISNYNNFVQTNLSQLNDNSLLESYSISKDNFVNLSYISKIKLVLSKKYINFMKNPCSLTLPGICEGGNRLELYDNYIEPELPITISVPAGIENEDPMPSKFFFVGSDSNQYWCELAGIKIYDLDNTEITNKMTNLSWVVAPNGGETNVNNVPRHGDAPMWNQKSFSLWTPNSKHRNKILFSFNLQDTSVGRVEAYTTNTESFGSNPKIVTEDGSVIFHTGDSGGLSVHYKAMSNKVFSNGVLSQPTDTNLTMGDNAIKSPQNNGWKTFTIMKINTEDPEFLKKVYKIQFNNSVNSEGKPNRQYGGYYLRNDDSVGDNNNIKQGGPIWLLNDNVNIWRPYHDGPTINFTDSEKQSNTLQIQFIQKDPAIWRVKRDKTENWYELNASASGVDKFTGVIHFRYKYFDTSFYTTSHSLTVGLSYNKYQLINKTFENTTWLSEYLTKFNNSHSDVKDLLLNSTSSSSEIDNNESNITNYDFKISVPSNYKIDTSLLTMLQPLISDQSTNSNNFFRLEAETADIVRKLKQYNYTGKLENIEENIIYDITDYTRSDCVGTYKIDSDILIKELSSKLEQIYNYNQSIDDLFNNNISKNNSFLKFESGLLSKIENFKNVMDQKLTTKNEIDTFMLNPVNDMGVLNNKKDIITLFNDSVVCPNIKLDDSLETVDNHIQNVTKVLSSINSYKDEITNMFPSDGNTIDLSNQALFTSATNLQEKIFNESIKDQIAQTDEWKLLIEYIFDMLKDKLDKITENNISDEYEIEDRIQQIDKLINDYMKFKTMTLGFSNQQIDIDKLNIFKVMLNNSKIVLNKIENKNLSDIEDNLLNGNDNTNNSIFNNYMLDYYNSVKSFYTQTGWKLIATQYANGNGDKSNTITPNFSNRAEFNNLLSRLPTPFYIKRTTNHNANNLIYKRILPYQPINITTNETNNSDSYLKNNGDLWYLLFHTWSINRDQWNKLNTHFKLYQADDEWKDPENASELNRGCDGNDPGIGFPRDCGGGYGWSSYTRSFGFLNNKYWNWYIWDDGTLTSDSELPVFEVQPKVGEQIPEYHPVTNVLQDSEGLNNLDVTEYKQKYLKYYIGSFLSPNDPSADTSISFVTVNENYQNFQVSKNVDKYSRFSYKSSVLNNFNNSTKNDIKEKRNLIKMYDYDKEIIKNNNKNKENPNKQSQINNISLVSNNHGLYNNYVNNYYTQNFFYHIDNKVVQSRDLYDRNFFNK